ncbi:MAG TPA: histidine phosphatase family protein [Roseimicrobium sp.]|nr:histidine phosphatase family protein [Roseimicrobium sp.]
MSDVLNSQVTRLHLIRHGEVETPYQKVFGGSRIDMNLSPKGQEQAEALGRHFETHRFDAIYVSPMKRAQQTLAPIAKRQPAKPITLDGLREVDFGSWTGLTWDQVVERHQVSAFDWLHMLEKGHIADAENTQQLRGRVEPCLNEILRDNPGKDVAVVCHGGIVRKLIAILLEIPIVKTAQFEIEYASISIVEHNARRSRLQLLNHTPWR